MMAASTASLDVALVVSASMHSCGSYRSVCQQGDRLPLCSGLALLGELKSFKPMAARVELQRVFAAHQSLH